MSQRPTICGLAGTIYVVRKAVSPWWDILGAGCPSEFEMNSIIFCNGDLVTILLLSYYMNSIVLSFLKYLNIIRMVVILRLVRLKYYYLFIS